MDSAKIIPSRVILGCPWRALGLGLVSGGNKMPRVPEPEILHEKPRYTVGFLAALRALRALVDLSGKIGQTGRQKDYAAGADDCHAWVLH